MLFSVNLISQLPGTPKGYNPPRFKDQFLTGCWIPASPLLLFLNTEFSKATDHNIFAGFQAFLDDFQEGFNCVERLFLWITDK